MRLICALGALYEKEISNRCAIRDDFEVAKSAFERPLNFVYEYGKFQSCVQGLVLRHIVPRTDPLQLSVVILSV